MTIDYRRFLGQAGERVLAYLGGGEVITEERALRVSGDVAPGWWRFAIRGRNAEALERADPAEEVLSRLAAAVGHWTGSRMVHGTGLAEPVHLLPEDELARFAPLRARRWHSGDLLFERVDLEGDAEDVARGCFEERRPLADRAGIPGTLRAAFALAVVADVSARTGVPAAPLEVRADLLEVADHGWPAADAALERLARERQAEAARVRERQRQPPVAVGPVPRADDVLARVAEALVGSGAALLATRRLADGLLVVTYRFLGERLSAVVRADSLQVVDAGVCLAGHDADLTLASLPGAVREGVDRGMLVITRHG